MARSAERAFTGASRGRRPNEDDVERGGEGDYETGIAAVREGPWLAISVIDAGPGVAPAERARIFEAFYRPRAQAPDAGASGLGLSIAQRLAELQEGTVQFAPRDEGGSIFTLRLPGVEWDPGMTGDH